MTKTKIILGVLLLAVIIPSSYAVTLPSTFFDEPCGGNPTNTVICEGVNAINDELEAQIVNIMSLNATQILQGTAIDDNTADISTVNGTLNAHVINFLSANVTLTEDVIETDDNTLRLDDILFNSTSINATSFLEVRIEQIIQDVNINTLESNVSTIQGQISSLQSTTNTQQTEINAIHEHVDVVNQNVAIGPLPVPQLETDYTALCNEGFQVKIPGSEIATLTNGVNTTSNIPELIVGTLGVTVEYTDTRQAFKMTVTNPDDVTGLSGVVTITCLTYPE